MTPVSETDEDLLQRYRDTGQTDCFGQLFDRYIPLIYGLCLKYLRDEEDAQDAVMQLFEELLPRVTQHEIRTFRTWLYTVARNHCLQLLRSREQAAEVELYPDFVESDVRCAQIKGTVEIVFRINTVGKPHGFVLKRSLCDTADREAIRLIEQGSRWRGDTAQVVTVKVVF